MSNPISSLPSAQPEDSDAPAVLSVDASEEVEAATDDASDSADADEQTSGEETGTRARTGLVVLILAGLLLGSVAINLKQSRDVSTLETRSTEYQQALAAAVERIDGETARADGAEAALDRVDSAVDVVNERVIGLQEALNGLREATVR